ncbi:MAG: 23S rRNA (guanosine(2251)-2'-O)-methyltransferase RlmB [Opitutales bacterium]
MATYARKRKNRLNRHTAGRAVIPERDETDLWSIVEEQAEPFVLILDRVQDPHNLGACLRTAEAAGVHAVVAPKKHTVGLTETVRQISTGAADTVPYIQVGNLGQTLRSLQDRGLFLVATSDHMASQELWSVDLTGPIGLVLGSEGEGVRSLTARTCDCCVNIPMAGQIDCLNLSVATGVCLFEAVRQRRAAGQ